MILFYRYYNTYYKTHKIFTKICLLLNLAQFIVYSIYFKKDVKTSNLLTHIYFNVLLTATIPILIINFNKIR
jgi:hypothetical protein